MENYTKTIEETTDKILELIPHQSYSNTQIEQLNDKLQYYTYKLIYNLKTFKSHTLANNEPFMILEYYLKPLLNKLQQMEVY